jgi:hypothetical protein
MHTHCSDAQILLHYLLAGLQWQFADCNVPECMRALGYTYKLQHARCTLFRIVACLTAKLPQSAATFVAHRQFCLQPRGGCRS